MPTTAYSKTFNGEFQVDQLENLHLEFKDSLKLIPDFREFIKSDVLCPCCNVPNAIVVSQGYSKTSKKPVTQAHFAFKNFDGLDSHHKFCDFYSGLDKEILTTNDCMIKFRKSNNLATEIVRKFICAGIENNVFSQKDILDMRQWFIDLKSTNSFYVNDNRIALKVLHQMIINDYKKQKQYIYNNDAIELINVDNEAIKLLAFKVPFRDLPDPQKKEDNWIYYFLSSKTIIENALKISIKDNQSYTYDRTLLEEKYKDAWQLAYKIASSDHDLSEKYGRSIFNKVKKVNSIMAYACLLLFINKWDLDASMEMHKTCIAPIDKVNNMNLGNVMGINPFVNYSEWKVLKFVDGWIKQLENFDLADELIKAKTDVLKYYS